MSAAHALPAEVRLYERLFTEATPDAGGRDFLEFLNPASKKVVRAWVEPTLSGSMADQRVQFERHGYFVGDREDSKAGALVFNLAVSLKDSRGGR